MNKPMIRLLSQHYRGVSKQCKGYPPTVAPEYSQQWTTYVKAEDLGYVDNFAITDKGLKALTGATT